MADAHFENAALARLYDPECGWSEDRTFYLDLAGPTPASILDLGCGTGLLLDAYAKRGHDVTGLDPATAMLEIARRRPHGNRINLIQGSAQDFSLGRCFDLIIMTGHAFQTLLSDEDIAATLACVRAHLKSGGRFVFETRNPAIDWRQRWTHRFLLETEDGQIEITRIAGPMRDGLISFDVTYASPAETLSSKSTLYFPTSTKIDELALKVGFARQSFFGDWECSPFDAVLHEEMIFSYLRDR